MSAYLLQTKKRSLKTGGPQYFLHGHSRDVRDILRREGSRPVVLQTPYGIVETPFVALSKDHKLDSGGNVVGGSVGKDRIQQGLRATESIGEAIRHWYSLKDADFDRIDIDIELHPDGHFIVSPVVVSWQEGRRKKEIEKPPQHPLSFHHREKSWVWQQQINAIMNRDDAEAAWIREQVCRVVQDHVRVGESNLQEFDVLRTSGALAKLGMHLGPARTKGYDCDPSEFRFEGYPAYPCPIELKTKSRGFNYQELRYKPLPRVVILCVRHDLTNLRPHVDVVELTTLCDYLSNAA